jgi:6-pyruvoyltetrahydropterin/6-carboxytetrahydropterin synthase
MEIFKTFTVECAHHLPRVPEGHKCRRLHGHSIRIEVRVRGEPWICDFALVNKAFAPLHEQLDLHYLNEIAGLENPTSESLARWVWDRLEPRLPGLFRVVVHETCTSGAIIEAAPALEQETR